MRLSSSHFFNPSTWEIVKSLTIVQISMEIQVCEKMITAAALRDEPCPRYESLLPLYQAAKLLSQTIEEATGYPAKLC